MKRRVPMMTLMKNSWGQGDVDVEVAPMTATYRVVGTSTLLVCLFFDEQFFLTWFFSKIDDAEAPAKGTAQRRSEGRRAAPPRRPERAAEPDPEPSGGIINLGKSSVFFS